jgi:hypothetical protein
MAGQQQSPLQERDRRFESGSLQRRVMSEPWAAPLRWRPKDFTAATPRESAISVFIADTLMLGLACCPIPERGRSPLSPWFLSRC